MMWPEPELRAIIRPEPEPEMKNRSLHSTSYINTALSQSAFRIYKCYIINTARIFHSRFNIQNLTQNMLLGKSLSHSTVEKC